MKSFILLSLMGFMFFSCKKTVPDNIAGTWKMVIVKDNATNSSITRPPSIEKDVIITFVPNSASAGTFTGQTPTNIIVENPYSLGANQAISIPVLSMTKVGETSWGSEFVYNIRDAQQYNFKAGRKLEIKTINKTLIFRKL